MKSSGYRLKSLLLLLIAVFMLMHPEIAVTAITDSLELCLKSVIPSLFPFFVLSEYWIRSGCANTVAETLLSELNRKTEKFSCEVIEETYSYTRAGTVIAIENINYLVEGSGHSIKNGIHYVKLDLRRW